jgi:membrane protease YdiL (CAAX protease family)
MSNDPVNPSLENPSEPLADPTPVPPPQPPAPREIWRPRDVFWLLAFTPFAILAAKFAVLFGYVILRPLAGWHESPDAVQSETIFLLVVQVVFYELILALLVLLARIEHQQPFWRSLGWRTPTLRQVAGYLLGGCGLAVTVNLALWLQPDVKDFPLEKMFDSLSASYALAAFAIAVAPLVEELVFRGVLFAVFERTVGVRFAVLGTAVLFAGLHIPEYWGAWNHAFIILLVGMVFSLARGVTGRLTPSVLLHIGYNSLMITGLFFSTEHFRNVTGCWVR